MTNNCHEPRADDAVLGQSPPPATAAVLGGLEGLKQRLSSTIVEVRLAAFSEALNYGQVGVDLIAQIARTKTGVRSAYTVFVDDNYHYQDESERYKLGVFEDCQSAVAACKKIVDEFLVHNYSVGMTPEDLYQIYTMFGEDPFLISDTAKSLFSAWNYAKERCAEICAG